MNSDAPYAPYTPTPAPHTRWWPWAAAFALHLSAAGLVWWLVRAPMQAVGNKGAVASEQTKAFDAQRLVWLDADVKAPVPELAPAQSKVQAAAKPATSARSRPAPEETPSPQPITTWIPPAVDVAMAQQPQPQPQAQFEPPHSPDTTASESASLDANSRVAMHMTAPVALDESTPAAAQQAATNSPPSVLQAYSPPPDYPALSQRLGEQGTVVLRVHVSAAGQPLAALLQQSSGFERLDRAAQQAVTAWRFVPAQRDGQAQTAWFEVPVRFELN